jgi:hypothetical protein
MMKMKLPRMLRVFTRNMTFDTIDNAGNAGSTNTISKLGIIHARTYSDDSSHQLLRHNYHIADLLLLLLLLKYRVGNFYMMTDQRGAGNRAHGPIVVYSPLGVKFSWPKTERFNPCHLRRS